MANDTTYLVREVDGSLWWRTLRQGPVRFLSAADLLRCLDELERAASGEILTGEFGWFVDRGLRRARVCGSRGSTLRSEWLRFAESLRTEAGWRGWDVGVAWEEWRELAAFSGISAIDSPPEPGRLDGWEGCGAAGLMTSRFDWFPHRWEAGELTFDWYHHDGTDVTVIDQDGGVRDYGFAPSDTEPSAVMLRILGRGAAILDELAQEAPCPHLSLSDAGLIVDVPRRTVRFWTRETLASSELAEAKRRWPGWTVEREPADLAGHLQRTGRTEEIDERDWPEPPYPPEQPARLLTFVRTRPSVTVAPPLPAEVEERLLALVAADPESDAPRLVYADWLLDHGDERGTLIRTQCELARLEREGDRSVRRRALEAESARLVRAHGPRLGIDMGHVQEIRRGFASTLSIHDVPTLVQKRTLARFPTVDAVHLSRRAGPNDVVALMGAEGALRLRSLSLSPDPGALRALARAPGALRHLSVATNDPAIAAELAEVLAAPGSLAGLGGLELIGHALGADEIRRLAEAPGFERLDRLALSVGPGGIPALVSHARAGGPISLALQGIGLDADGAAAIIGSERLGRLRDLSLDGRRIAGDSAVRLAQVPGLARLRSLALPNSQLTAADLAALAASPHLGGLDELRIEPLPDEPDALTALRARFGAALA